MNDRAEISLGRYYRSFKGSLGLLASVVVALPLISKPFSDTAGKYAFPSLGDIESPARIGTVVLALAATYAAYFGRGASTRYRFRRVAGLVATAAFFLVLYLTLSFCFVRRIDIPTRGTSVFVSVGYERTEFAKTTFGSATDEEMLRQRGPDEEQVRRLWTPLSLLLARLGLLASYCGFVLALVLALSVGIIFQLEDSKSR